ncbi:MAG TPA: hypothetical protein DDY68_05965 [Porphyromonadaceae bacterium]|nr:hypothetical protein [Porphyromonadaceae bacterium]
MLRFPIRRGVFLWGCIFLLLFSSYAELQGADAKTKEEDIEMHKKKKKLDTIPFFNRAMVGINLFEPIACAFGQSYWASGILLRADFKELLLPVVEFGISKADVTNSSGTRYKSNKGTYFSFGIDMRLTGNPAVGCLYFGVRLGFASMNYDIYDAKISNNFWGENYKTNILNQKATASYIHLQIGIKAKMYKSLYMGWALRYGFILSDTPTENSQPYYIPGFGVRNSSGTLSFSYSIYFKLPLRPSRKPLPKNENTTIKK